MIDLDKLVRIPNHPEPHTYYWSALETRALETLRSDTAKAVAQRCVEICQEQRDMPECPERAEYCAQAIADEFGLGVQG